MREGREAAKIAEEGGHRAGFASQRETLGLVQHPLADGRREVARHDVPHCPLLRLFEEQAIDLADRKAERQRSGRINQIQERPLIEKDPAGQKIQEQQSQQSYRRANGTEQRREPGSDQRGRTHEQARCQ